MRSLLRRHAAAGFRWLAFGLCLAAALGCGLTLVSCASFQRTLVEPPSVPGATFLVGADTALRLVAPRYYEYDEQRLRQALDCCRQQHCRFLVAGRLDGSGRYVTMEETGIPEGHGDLFRAIAADDFRIDISSTLLRERRDLL